MNGEGYNIWRKCFVMDKIDSVIFCISIGAEWSKESWKSHIHVQKRWHQITGTPDNYVKIVKHLPFLNLDKWE